MSLHRNLRLLRTAALVAVLFCLSACTSETEVASVVIEAGACESVSFDAGGVPAGKWTVEGAQFLLLTDKGAGSVAFRAPSVARETAIVFRAAKKVVVVNVIPQPVDESYAVGMAPGCAPFRHGVASGDPMSDAVLLWTRITPDASGIQSITWDVSATLGFESPVASGAVTADAATDYTVTVEAGGLAPNTTYYYRFVDAEGRSSPIGRTRTAPEGAIENVRMALVSCSSLYSGYFNAYRRLAERDDLDLVLHVGDYIYDFVDEDEQFRLPVPFPTEPETLDEFRARHAFYLGDPDLRAARAAHPWMVIWDNHDLEWDEPPAYRGGLQAFREWVPMRNTDPAQRPAVGYRTLRYGDLVDVSFGDMMLHRDKDMVPGTGAPSMLGAEQFEWFAGELTSSAATWHLVGFQKLFMPLLSNFGGGESTWTGYPEARTRFLDFMRDNAVEDVVMVSGDAHFTMVGDVTEDPEGVNGDYDPDTGAGALAVEYLGGSISRGNFDETFRGTPETMAAIEQEFLGANPHFVFADLTRHGYALLDIRTDRVVAEWWVSPILEPSDTEAFVSAVTVRQGAMHWERELSYEPTSAKGN